MKQNDKLDGNGERGLSKHNGFNEMKIKTIDGRKNHLFTEEFSKQ